MNLAELAQAVADTGRTEGEFDCNTTRKLVAAIEQLTPEQRQEWRALDHNRWIFYAHFFITLVNDICYEKGEPNDHNQ